MLGALTGSGAVYGEDALCGATVDCSGSMTLGMADLPLGSGS